MKLAEEEEIHDLLDFLEELFEYEEDHDVLFMLEGQNKWTQMAAEMEEELLNFHRGMEDAFLIPCDILALRVSKEKYEFYKEFL